MRLGAGKCGEKGREDRNGIFLPSYWADLPRPSESRTARISCESLLLLLLTLRHLAISPMAAGVLISLAQSCGPAGISSKERAGLALAARHVALHAIILPSALSGCTSWGTNHLWQMQRRAKTFLFLSDYKSSSIFPESEPRR